MATKTRSKSKKSGFHGRRGRPETRAERLPAERVTRPGAHGQKGRQRLPSGIDQGDSLIP